MLANHTLASFYENSAISLLQPTLKPQKNLYNLARFNSSGDCSPAACSSTPLSPAAANWTARLTRSCQCQCPTERPVYREDYRQCVNTIEGIQYSYIILPTFRRSIDFSVDGYCHNDEDISRKLNPVTRDIFRSSLNDF